MPSKHNNPLAAVVWQRITDLHQQHTLHSRNDPAARSVEALQLGWRKDLPVTMNTSRMHRRACARKLLKQLQRGGRP